MYVPSLAMQIADTNMNMQIVICATHRIFLRAKFGKIASSKSHQKMRKITSDCVQLRHYGPSCILSTV